MAYGRKKDPKDHRIEYEMGEIFQRLPECRVGLTSPLVLDLSVNTKLHSNAYKVIVRVSRSPEQSEGYSDVVI